MEVEAMSLDPSPQPNTVSSDTAGTLVPESPTSTGSINRATSAAAAAAERRAQQPGRTVISASERLRIHERKQAFRRMINPGIMRPNSKDIALASLRTLSTIAENILRDPTNPKFQEFKQTNTRIQKDLVQPKGALEYAVEMGFRPEIRNFQPYYVWNPQKLEDLQWGAEIIQEALTLENEKVARAQSAQGNKKAEAAAAMERVKLAFIDDRRQKEALDERERVLRQARADAPPPPPAHGNEPSISPARNMPGSGHTLTGETVAVTGAPPPYEATEDSD